jgi:hypothetical protein
MEIVIVKDKITLEKVKQLAQDSYGEMVKAVADIEQDIIAIGGEYHADAEQLLLQQGSQQHALWGFNIYPDQNKETWLEYYSLINIRPRQNNKSQIIELDEVKQKIKALVDHMIEEN